jgi:hypothetical protein
MDPVQVCGLMHWIPQVPQLLLSFVVSTLQPFARSELSQLANPVRHMPLQLPPEQLWVAMLTDEQAMPHEPQFAGSLVVSMLQPFVRNVLSQLAKPDAQVPLQLLPEQLWATLTDEQPMPHPPQLLGSLVVLTLQPLARSVLSQLTNPVRHVP